MTKQHLLLVDGDSRSRRALEASLRGAGFGVTTAVNGDDALARCRVSAPDLIVSETELPGMDGFELCRALKADDRLRDTAFLFLTGSGSVDEKVRGLELGVEDFLTKPIDSRELVARIRLAIEKKEKERLLRREQRASISGSLADMPLADLIQTLDVGRKSGTVRLEDPEGRSGTIWLRDGFVVDAAAGRLRGEGAFHRLLRWREGRFAIDFGPIERPARMTAPTQHLLLDGMRRLDEWSRTLARLPPARTVLQIDYLALSDRLAEIPDDLNTILKLVNGRRTLAQVIEEAEHDDLSTVSALEVLVREGILQVRAPHVDAAREGGAAPSPIAVASLPSRDGAAQGLRAERVDWFAGPAAPAAPPAVPPVLAPAARTRSRERTEEPLPVTAVEPAPEHPADPPPPRIVRFAAKPRNGLAPASASLPTAPGPVDLPSTLTPTPALPREAPPAGRSAGRFGAIAAALLVVALLAWAIHSAPTKTPGAGSPAPMTSAAASQPAGAGNYDTALVAARREHAAAHLAEAIAQYRTALGFRETGPALEGLGGALHESGDRVGAIEALRRAIEVDPSRAAPYMALARLYREARRTDEAKAAYQQYLSLEPQGSHADEARAAIAASGD